MARRRVAQGQAGDDVIHPHHPDDNAWLLVLLLFAVSAFLLTCGLA